MVSNLFRHLNNLLIGMQKKIGSLIHPVIIQIILKRLTVFLSEQLSEIGAVDIIFLAKPLECEVIRIMFLNFFLYISENTSGYILAKLGQIVSVLTGETHQMCLTAAHRSCFKAALRNQTQDFFLIDLIILLACKMDQLKKQIVNIEVRNKNTSGRKSNLKVSNVSRVITSRLMKRDGVGMIIGVRLSLIHI